MASSGWNDMRGDIYAAGQQAAMAAAEAAQEIKEAIERSTTEIVGSQQETTLAVKHNTHVLQAGLSVLDAHARELAALTSEGFSGIAQRLDLATSHLSSIEYMQANPFKTGAAELFREGVEALRNRWYEEASDRFDRSIERDPLNPATRAAQGYALAAQDFNGRAFDEFAYAVRYSSKHPSNAPLAAASAQSMAALADASQRQAVLQGLESALQMAPTCAELYLTRAHLTGSKTDLRKAFLLAPELSLVAVEAGLPEAELIAEGVYEDADGPIQRWFVVGELLNTLPPLEASSAVAWTEDEAPPAPTSRGQHLEQVTFDRPPTIATAMVVHGLWASTESSSWMQLAHQHIEASTVALHEAQSLSHDAEEAVRNASAADTQAHTKATEIPARDGWVSIWLKPAAFGLIALFFLGAGGFALLFALAFMYLFIKHGREALRQTKAVRRANTSLTERHRTEIAKAREQVRQLQESAALAQEVAERAADESRMLTQNAEIARRALDQFDAARPNRLRPLAGL